MASRIMVTTQGEAEHLTRYLDVRTAVPARADLLFVFGTRYPDPAHIAARLFRCGVGHHIVLTGGANRLTGVVEAREHLRILLTHGLSRERVILEAESTNTLENVLFALPMLGKRVGLERIESVVAVTKWYHCRRAVMTLKRHLPRGIRYFAVTYEPEGMARSDWWRSESGMRRVAKEVDRIPKYLASGDIAGIERRDGALL